MLENFFAWIGEIAISYYKVIKSIRLEAQYGIVFLFSAIIFILSIISGYDFSAKAIRLEHVMTLLVYLLTAIGTFAVVIQSHYYRSVDRTRALIKEVNFFINDNEAWRVKKHSNGNITIVAHLILTICNYSYHKIEVAKILNTQMIRVNNRYEEEENEIETRLPKSEKYTILIANSKSNYLRSVPTHTDNYQLVVTIVIKSTEKNLRDRRVQAMIADDFISIFLQTKDGDIIISPKNSKIKLKVLQKMKDIIIEGIEK